MVPASRPRLAGVVVINDPRGADYYGGLVAAPVFGRVMPGALRLLNVTPDRVDVRLAHAAPALGAGEGLPVPVVESPYAEGVPP